MERKELPVTSFFKVMMPGFDQKLRLPPAISKVVQKQKSGRGGAFLQSRLGKWRITLYREDDLICFNLGWPEFVDRHALTIGDFLYFIHTGDLHFHVYVFDHTACEKEFRDERTKEEATEALTLTSIRGEEEEEDGNPIPCFEKKMVAFCASAPKLSKINIPIKFMRSNNLGVRTSVTLRDPSGRAWLMKLEGGYDSVERFKLGMYGEWPDFYASNDIKDGDICVFQLVRRLLTPTTLFFDIQILRAP